MRSLFVGLVLAVVLVGCSTPLSSMKPTPTRVAAVDPQPTSGPALHPTATSNYLIHVSATPAYRAFLASVCQAFVSRDVPALQGFLPNYQYDTGLRYGSLGDGEGQTGSPSLFGSWLAGAKVTCVAYTPDLAGHATILTSGWKRAGGSALIDVDTFNGAWKFNDFTFGTEPALRTAMNGAVPAIRYQG